METDYTSLHGKVTSACSNIERSTHCSKTVQLTWQEEMDAVVLECNIEINCLLVVYNNIELMLIKTVEISKRTMYAIDEHYS